MILSKEALDSMVYGTVVKFLTPEKKYARGKKAAEGWQVLSLGAEPETIDSARLMYYAPIPVGIDSKALDSMPSGTVVRLHNPYYPSSGPSGDHAQKGNSGAWEIYSSTGDILAVATSHGLRDYQPYMVVDDQIDSPARSMVVIRTLTGDEHVVYTDDYTTALESAQGGDTMITVPTTDGDTLTVRIKSIESCLHKNQEE